jgi:hypothetical protein
MGDGSLGAHFIEAAGSAMETESGSNPEEPAQKTTATGPKKRWWVIAGGAVAAAFLAALGAWLFSRVSPILDSPFAASALEVYVDDSEKECDSYALPASLLEAVPVVELDDGFPAQLAEFDGEWIVERGGLPTVVRSIRLTLHGNGDETVVIHSIDLADFEAITPDEELVVIHECLPIGGEMAISSLSTNFAPRPPVLELTDPELQFPYQVSKDDPEVFDIHIAKQGEGDEQACFCRWNVRITWSAGEELQHLVVEGESLGVATAVPAGEWEDRWFVDGEWSAEIPGD